MGGRARDRGMERHGRPPGSDRLAVDHELHSLRRGARHFSVNDPTDFRTVAVCAEHPDGESRTGRFSAAERSFTSACFTIARAPWVWSPAHTFPRRVDRGSPVCTEVETSNGPGSAGGFPSRRPAWTLIAGSAGPWRTRT